MSRRRLPLFLVLAVALVVVPAASQPATAATAPAGQRRRARDLPTARRVHLRALDGPTGRRRIDLDRFVVRRCGVPAARATLGSGVALVGGGRRFAARRVRPMQHCCATQATRSISARSDRDTSRSSRSRRARFPVAGSDAGMWGEFQFYHRGAAGLLRFSPVGFSPSGREAVVFTKWECGPACGHSVVIALRADSGIDLAHRRHAAPQLAQANEHERQLSVPGARHRPHAGSV